MDVMLQLSNNGKCVVLFCFVFFVFCFFVVVVVFFLLSLYFRRKWVQLTCLRGVP